MYTVQEGDLYPSAHIREIQCEIMAAESIVDEETRKKTLREIYRNHGVVTPFETIEKMNRFFDYVQTIFPEHFKREDTKNFIANVVDLSKIIGELNVSQKDRQKVYLLFTVLEKRFIEKKFAFIGITADRLVQNFYDLAENFTPKRFVTNAECGACGRKDVPLTACKLCGMASYCNKACQSQDWLAFHVRFCLFLADNRENSAAYTPENIYTTHQTQCSYCQQSKNGLLACGGCKINHYCNKECQRNDWRQLHRNQCEYLKGYTRYIDANNEKDVKPK